MSIQHSHTAACTWIKPRRQISTQDRLYLQNKNVKKQETQKKKKKDNEETLKENIYTPLRNFHGYMKNILRNKWNTQTADEKKKR